jgi:hypothetical protein
VFDAHHLELLAQLGAGCVDALQVSHATGNDLAEVSSPVSVSVCAASASMMAAVTFSAIRGERRATTVLIREGRTARSAVGVGRR